MKIQAATRLRADWFDDMSPEQQKKYVQDHTDSEHAQRYDDAQDAAESEPDDTADRVAYIRKQIRELSHDIEELKAEGEDYSKERKLRDRYKEELNTLSHKG